jgi:tankyrase
MEEDYIHPAHRKSAKALSKLQLDSLRIQTYPPPIPKDDDEVGHKATIVESESSISGISLASSEVELLLGVKEGDLTVVKKIVQEVGDVNIKGESGTTALHQAALYGQVECLEYLLEHAANVNSVDGFNSTPLHNAAFAGHLECLSLLLRSFADVNIVDRDGSTALHKAVYPQYPCIIITNLLR